MFGHQRMASREFTDDRGEVWEVWAVEPESLDRRTAENDHPTPPLERRATRESRVRVTNPLLANGWLAFESRNERRRFAPIPESWTDLDEVALRALLTRATAAGDAQRLLE
jgi:hypothetical protein